MRKTLLVIPILLLSLCGSPVLADDDTPTLGTLAQQQELAEERPAPETRPTPRPEYEPVDGDIYGEIAHSSNIDINNEKAKGAASALQSLASIVITFLVYLITIGMVGVTMLDIVYVSLPFTRTLLHRGQSPDMGMGMPGMGAMPGIQPGGGGMPGMGGEPSGGGLKDIQLISNGAIIAVEKSKSPGPTGEPQSALKVYTKQMWHLFVLTPILIVLATNGVLVNIGFGLGALISNILQGLMQGF